MRVNNLKKLREYLGFSQKRMAEELGVPLRTYQDWEYGKRKINKVALELLKYKFAINPDWLLTGEGEMFVKQEGKDELLDQFLQELERIRRDFGEEHYQRALKLAKKLLQDIQTFSESSTPKKKKAK